MKKLTLKEFIREEFYKLINENISEDEVIKSDDREISLESSYLGKLKGFNVWNVTSEENGKKIIEKYLHGDNKPPLYYRDVRFIPKYIERDFKIYYFIKDMPEKLNDWVGVVKHNDRPLNVFNGEDRRFDSSSKMYKFVESVLGKLP